MARVLVVDDESDFASAAVAVAATNRVPESAIADHALRQDLYFRLSAFPIVVPPLRDRPSDIPLLAQFFLDEFSKRVGERYFSETDDHEDDQCGHGTDTASEPVAAAVGSGTTHRHVDSAPSAVDNSVSRPFPRMVIRRDASLGRRKAFLISIVTEPFSLRLDCRIWNGA